MITHPIDKIDKIEVFDLQVSEQSTLVVEYTDISLSSLWATLLWRSSSSGSSSHRHSLEAVISDYNRDQHVFSYL